MTKTAFVEYCWSFYRPGAIYGDFFSPPLLRDELTRAVDRRSRCGDFCGDSLDREAVRELILAARRGESISPRTASARAVLGGVPQA